MIRAILYKDWLHYWKAVCLITMVLLFPNIFVDAIRVDIQKAFHVGIVVAAAYVYSQFCFQNEINHRTLSILLHLPVHPFELVLVKYISLYSMILFTMSTPVAFTGDWKQCLINNGFSLLLATIFMTTSIIWDGNLGPQVILFILILTTYPMNYPLVRDWLTTHLLILSLCAFVIAPIIALISAIPFTWVLE